MAEVTPLTLDDYDAIADAVQETERGRWFLAEFARRNRAADTAAVLDALAGLERRLGMRGRASPEVAGLIHEALDRASRARGAAPETASALFDALERTLRRAAEELGAPAPERLVAVSIEEVPVETSSAAPTPLALAAPRLLEAVVVDAAQRADAPAAVEKASEPEDAPIASPSIAFEEPDDEPEPASPVGAAAARPTPSLAGRPSLLLDSLSEAERAILFA